MDVMTLPAAAARLGVSTRQAQRLAASGILTRPAGNVVTAESVARAVAARPAHAPLKRAWAEPTAWAAIGILSGRDEFAQAIGTSQASRLRSNLRRTSPEALSYSLRERAHIRRLDGHSSAIEHIRSRVIEPRVRDSNLTARNRNLVDGYLSPTAAATTSSEFTLVPATRDANIVLRITDFPYVAEIAEADNVLAGVDLVDSVDVRERAEGLRILARALSRFAR
jgi:hypothetical protein